MQTDNKLPSLFVVQKCLFVTINIFVSSRVAYVSVDKIHSSDRRDKPYSIYSRTLLPYCLKLLSHFRVYFYIDRNCIEKLPIICELSKARFAARTREWRYIGKVCRARNKISCPSYLLIFFKWERFVPCVRRRRKLNFRTIVV